ncbi:hypothetical protein PTTG_30007 [Puccinia triticina 1-1 BBBD Race 1]|uniref:Lysophospholipase n=1 Tax=Puccinia triticina (isolate 1-1 / race 1 (BBBD)) TaxID=630390 RepID=A0A180G0N3_PUCT1|nr:hypothetical protein PTTG_30007 [Puccinia triticina 1-1 BBBD Race 1]
MPLAYYPLILGLDLIFLLGLTGKVYSQVLTASLPSYAPVSVECPAKQQLLRLAGTPTGRNQSLSEAETNYLKGRKSVINPLWHTFFTKGPGKDTGYQSISLLTKNQQDWPVFAIAHSGGGLRASLYAAGVLQALDSRSSSSPLRGAYSLSTYVTGLSGGSWLVASAAANNYPTAPEMVKSWQLEIDLAIPGGANPSRNVQFLDALHDTVKLKQAAGYNISLTDHWGRALGYHFLPGTSSENFYTNSPTAHGAGMLFSSLRNTQSMRNHQVPLPIIVSNHKPVNEAAANPSNLPVSGATYVPLSAPVYECSPFEFGSFDPQLSAFIPSEFLGTTAKNAKKLQKNTCVQGFDHMSFIMVSSATLFNTIAGLPTQYTTVLQTMARKISGSLDKSLTARYPNAFRGVNGPAGFDRSRTDELVIVDGGENGENIPLSPLLVPVRQVDVILAADASRDSDSSGVNGDGWPNGSSMINTFLRVTKVLPAGTANFPPVPLNPQVWEKKGLTSRPAFFGCEAPTKQGNGGYPLVIYLPNSPTRSPPFTNYSTFKLQYSKKETSSFLTSVMESTTKPRISISRGDADWPTCLSCALIDRTRNRQGVPRSDPCSNCFKRYCFS